MGRGRFIKPYMGLIIAIGAAISLFSLSRLSLAELDLRFWILALLTVSIGSRLTVKIPRLSSHISASDTFIFLAMLLYGGEAAILLAAAGGFCSSLHFSRKASTLLFNAAVMACSTFLTVWTLRLLFGPIKDTSSLPHSGYTAAFIMAICVMALAQYIFNSGLVSLLASFKIDQPLWHTWHKHYLWTSITYFAGASAAGIIAILINAIGFYAVVVTIPIIAIIFFTYETYLRHVETSAAQAEQAERHVKELSHYIDELKRAEEERDALLVREQEARAEAEAANRLKDEFLAIVSHELRTPLTPIIGWAHMLRTGIPNEMTYAQALEAIERNAQIQVQLINDLLDVSRIITGKLYLDIGQVNLDAVIESALDVMRPAADAKGVRILYRRDSEVGPVSGDRGRLQQVVWNLLSNAVKFTPEGGQVEVRLERVGSQAKITVSDTGEGISPNFLPYVFDRFRQADSTTTRDHGGLGLGLAIVRHLVELHGGTVYAESAGKGQGATFSVSIPLVVLRAGGSDLERAYHSIVDAQMIMGLPTLDGLQVLVVDDEKDTRQMIGAVLERSGAEVRTSASTREALEVLGKWRPDVLISDIGMPGEDGYALIHQVRALPESLGGEIPAVALTAYARDEDRRRVLAAGYQMHLAKPISPVELLAMVAELSGRTEKVSSQPI